MHHGAQPNAIQQGQLAAAANATVLTNTPPHNPINDSAQCVRSLNILCERLTHLITVCQRSPDVKLLKKESVRAARSRLIRIALTTTHPKHEMLLTLMSGNANTDPVTQFQDIEYIIEEQDRVWSQP
jgi:hypothetical protein